METFTGKCKYCGNEQPVMAESQEAADEMVSADCECSGAETSDKRSHMKSNIQQICSNDFNGAFEPLEQSAINAIKEAADGVIDGLYDGVTFDARLSKVSIKIGGDDKIKVSRTTTKKQEAEA